eukprot:CAMPEP_0194504938 /NCGR_PEP_ID=MMETSP0253-20130528/30544_1 /TAXON_ID=2966 /ORGANISM="Noctiluca scintillans" /LENGTH=57 /DNA_ID=CAMNT_0039347409 /DNA_START=46 /DNA_END=216 /DNA_ORIENTATION=+
MSTGSRVFASAVILRSQEPSPLPITMTISSLKSSTVLALWRTPVLLGFNPTTLVVVF